MNFRSLLIVPLAALVLSAGATGLPMPDGWMTARYATLLNVPTGGYSGDGYEIGIDTSISGGLPSLTIRSIAPLKKDLPAVGHAYQTVTGYAGQRVRFSGQVRAEAASAWAGLYLGLGENDVLMPVTMGQAGVEKKLPAGAAVPAADGVWREVSVVMDVPADAPFLTLGAAQVGEGQVWVRDLKFEVVGPEVPPTTATVGIDWAQARRFHAQARENIARISPQPLRNAALD
ncbi:hypothetical protein ACG04R_17365 [Roseateles sp. BYS78W]|uniref:Uncharacterized protein n=1 Tax=Pelomonas candidula TaxID=3299025 RepID=A0ABW7HEX7_9BURK